MMREPVVAGRFYPADPAALLDEIETYLVPTETPLKAKAIIVPHAGYIYSGAIAGYAYGAVQLPSLFIILGPNHTGRGAPLSLYPGGEWQTPLGRAGIDDALNEKLLQECPGLKSDRLAHQQEHSLEVQIPFLQALVPAMRFSAICVGTSDYAELEALGLAMARVVCSCPEPVMIICSSDMNHFESAKTAETKDRSAIAMMEQLDGKGLYRVVIEKQISMCGCAPAVATLKACVELGAQQGHLLKYANSGDVNGDYGSVVGYAALAIV
jgi:AmmeMemoRadiSam system protein B